MAGKVFISCGQRPGTERDTAEKIAAILRDKFNLKTYLAFKIQGLEDIMTITKELRSSDYYLFIDFKRETNSESELACSLFTHQELALAHHLGFQEMIALKQEGVPFEGFIKYVLSNPEDFSDETDLLQKIESLVRERKWNPYYSRNLVISDLRIAHLPQYRDHTVEERQRVCLVKIENKRPDVAAVGTICILDYFEVDGKTIPSPDRSYLKWAGQSGYERTIMPNDYGEIDIFAVSANRAGIFLHSLRDLAPREPIITKENGECKLFYKLFSQGFPLIEFGVKVKINWISQRPIVTSNGYRGFQWNEATTAELL